ncbi:bifunctional phosphopantothenoylcysteine decarboxylase/phosphopantothenate--cysteine ligase CoaBC [Reinekea blandensis]|uniref:Coenzyme A biosynthesis bifunctional protein CoaBC n=1 Tax=Reinekea blandensis MED297 TaxID=314283 RepID=A4BAA5_9GAMM|nr:bifunctional phosphopantothenoylcysteine decarboxylase/phosphopantothenate--cysteine ligase CoaBC [Reinekea blandensis]EAR10861.1 phosphopantothenoylcysteine synthase/decarboxylase [Reinekea sp. MED297] [Reinekea blandensis MED297]
MEPLALRDKRILVGITGGIAAYKSADLVRQLIKAGAEVRVVMTPAACEFITPLTLQALSGQPVSRSLLDESAEMGMGHIELARWADLMLIAPATADFIARLNAGMANDLLSTLCLATQTPIALAPAMNEKMWLNPLTQANLSRLQSVLPTLRIFGPASGEQACGDLGYGRMLEPSELVQLTASQFQTPQLKGKHLVITAGPTREAIDPVRYLSNHSSGKMGFALAEQAARMGASVTLISGPVTLPTPAGVTRIDVTSAQQMLQAAEQSLTRCDAFIATAAVADYRPSESAAQKLKKGEADLSRIELTENPDIVATIARHSMRPSRVIAFAAETQDLEAYAQRKLDKKQVDAVVANDVSRTDIGFGSDQNEVLWVTRDQSQPFGPDTKSAVATFILEQLMTLDTSA